MYFKKLNLSSEIEKEAMEILEHVVHNKVQHALDPCVYQSKYSAWFIDEKLYLDFPKGGFESRPQLNIALSLWKANTTLSYQKLFDLSKFIEAGLTS